MPRAYRAAQPARPGEQRMRGRCAAAGRGGWLRTDPDEIPTQTSILEARPCVRRVASGGQLVQAGGKKTAAARRPAAEAGEARAAALRVLIAEDNAINMKARRGAAQQRRERAGCCGRARRAPARFMLVSSTEAWLYDARSWL